MIILTDNLKNVHDALVFRQVNDFWLKNLQYTGIGVDHVNFEIRNKLDFIESIGDSINSDIIQTQIRR